MGGSKRYPSCFARAVMGFEKRPTHPTSLSILLHRTCDKLTRRVKFRFRRRANHLYDSRHPVPEEGALAIVTERWDGMRWMRRHRARDGIAGRASGPVSGHRTC